MMTMWIKSITLLVTLPFFYIIGKWLLDGFTVTVHADPEVPLIGQGLMLSCHLIGKIPTNFQVHWYKWERNKNMTLYFYNSTSNGSELVRAWDEHRSITPKGWYENGIVKVRLFPVQAEDRGQYVCAVTGDNVYQEAIAEVIIAGFGSTPRLIIEQQQNNSTTLRCTSHGWYPLPEVLWTDSTGQNISTMAETRIQKSVTELYEIDSTLRVADIASDIISCTVINPLLKKHRENVIAISDFFDVEAEHETITAVIGENIILPCRLITKHVPPSMELQWRKVESGEDKTIYFYLYDESSPLINSYPEDDKCPMGYLSPNGSNSREWLRKEYEKKAEVFKGKEFGKGNISLKLNNIQVEDTGKYICSATSNIFHREIIIEVVFGGNETSLQVHQQKICGYECKWTGWYPKPRFSWRNHKGESLNSLADTKEMQEENNHFTVASSIAVPCDTPEVTCAIVNTESTDGHLVGFLIGLVLFIVVTFEHFFGKSKKHFQNMVDQMKRERDQSRDDYDQLRLEMDELQMERVQFRSDYAQLWEKMDQLQREMNELQRQRGRQQVGNKLLQLENEALREKCGPFQMARPTAPQIIEQLQCEKEELLVERERLQVENNQVQHENKQLREKCGWFKVEKSSLQQKIRHLQVENGQLQLENEQVRWERKQMQLERDELRMEKGRDDGHSDEEMKIHSSQLEKMQRQNDQLREDKKYLERILKQIQQQKEQLQREIDEMRKELEWRRIRNNSVDITLHEVTAHPNLSIAGDKKSLKHESTPQKVLPAPERFDLTVCVLGSQGFSSGKHYWEVDVGSSTNWDLGVARKYIQRKGNLSLFPKEGFWVLGFSGTDYWAKTDPWTQVMVQKKPQKIGVYLSYQEGQVTFFNVTGMSVLFTFSNCSFAGDVYPFFKNSHKETIMRICSITEE
nr:selection and upkeep of intraepithelial T-cells protein 5-like isoform X4 [Pelodiscus sinensis]|eukprot:XP_025046549.1 selection and upkeep of intraepithelial T-cells protein 5-like isoform X4 [Pelodiscus sinensis]